jgi:hypothetical protein
MELKDTVTEEERKQTVCSKNRLHDAIKTNGALVLTRAPLDFSHNSVVLLVAVLRCCDV